MKLSGKKVLLCITGSIAAYKAADLCRLLIKEGAGVKVIMTSPASSFITPLTLSVVSKNTVYTDFLGEGGNWNNHVELGMWADLMLVAPATANIISKMATGQCDNFLLATYLSARCPVMIAPAMDHDMYLHPATQNNLEVLSKRKHFIVGPAKGELASGLTGEGRLEEPETLLKAVVDFFLTGNELKGINVLVSAGPTREAIDPVRFISNRSSGKMGFAIAEQLRSHGANVTLVAGPNNLVQPYGIHYIGVESAKQMADACLSEFTKSSIIIMSAAVADYTPEVVAEQKIKKSSASPNIVLTPSVDILAQMGQQKKNNQFLVGFALETEDALRHAIDKLKRKNLDLIVLNTLADHGAGFEKDTNKITLIDKKEKVINFDLKSKKEVAADIVNKIIELTHA